MCERRLSMSPELQSKILQRVDKISNRRTLCDRFVIAMEALLKASPENFSELEGLTREAGHVVFVSADRRKIENTAPNANPKKLPSGNWYVNIAGGQQEFEIVVDTAQKRLGLPISFVAELKRKTILRPEVEYE